LLIKQKSIVLLLFLLMVSVMDAKEDSQGKRQVNIGIPV
jgi:hypothetical protein